MPADILQKVIGGCRIERKLGQGGMGSVYLAHNIKLDISVALKILSTDLASNVELTERFITEARAAARLSSIHIVLVRRVDEDQGFHFIEMEFVKGESLKSKIDQFAPFPKDLALQYLYQICLGLGEAHKFGIIHRDIKPENILISTNGILKIADFGLAKLSQDTAHLTQPGQLMGTPYYIAPEQCEGKIADARSDIYALGITLYYMLTKTLPFCGDSPLTTLLARLNRNPVPPRQIVPEIPEDFQNLTLKMIARYPKDRYQNIQEILIELGALIKKYHVQLPWLGMDIGINGLLNTPPIPHIETTNEPTEIGQVPKVNPTVVSLSSPTMSIKNENNLPESQLPEIAIPPNLAGAKTVPNVKIPVQEKLPETKKYKGTTARSSTAIQGKSNTQVVVSPRVANVSSSHTTTKAKQKLPAQHSTNSSSTHPHMPSMIALEESLRKNIPDHPLSTTRAKFPNLKHIIIGCIGLVLFVAFAYAIPRGIQENKLVKIKANVERSWEEKRYLDFVEYVNDYYCILYEHPAWKKRDEEQIFRKTYEDKLKKFLLENQTTSDGRTLIEKLREIDHAPSLQSFLNQLDKKYYGPPDFRDPSDMPPDVYGPPRFPIPSNNGEQPPIRVNGQLTDKSTYPPLDTNNTPGLDTPSNTTGQSTQTSSDTPSNTMGQPTQTSSGSDTSASGTNVGQGTDNRPPSDTNTQRPDSFKPQQPDSQGDRPPDNNTPWQQDNHRPPDNNTPWQQDNQKDPDATPIPTATFNFFASGSAYLCSENVQIQNNKLEMNPTGFGLKHEAAYIAWKIPLNAPKKIVIRCKMIQHSRRILPNAPIPQGYLKITVDWKEKIYNFYIPANYHNVDRLCTVELNFQQSKVEAIIQDNAMTPTAESNTKKIDTGILRFDVAHSKVIVFGIDYK